MSKEDTLKTVRDRLPGSNVNNGNRQQLLPVEEVKSFIRQCFEYVAVMPEGKVIMMPLIGSLVRRIQLDATETGTFFDLQSTAGTAQCAGPVKKRFVRRPTAF